MKKLGFGLMRLPLTDKDNASSIDLSQVCLMADSFIENGFTYFDTAYMYHQGASERAVKEVLIKRHDRNSFTLASKLPVMLLHEKGEQEKIFMEQLERTGAGYFDYYLLHALDKNHYQTASRLNSFDFIADLKKKGLVKKVGFSFHDSANVLDKILTERPEMEFVQLQINYLDWQDAGVQSRLCYETALKHGKPIVVMEPVKGGRLAAVPHDAEYLLKKVHPEWSVASWAIRYAASLPGVMTVLSGMSDRDQLNDNISYMKDFVPLNSGEISALRAVADILRGEQTVPCTACRYCTDGCPRHIAIPEYFALYNRVLKGEEKEFVLKEYNEYAAKGHGKAIDCISCGKCEKSCPQHLPVSTYIKRVASKLDIAEK